MTQIKYIEDRTKCRVLTGGVYQPDQLGEDTLPKISHLHFPVRLCSEENNIDI